jgi:capsular polysaccharide biosynthesis protein
MDGFSRSVEVVKGALVTPTHISGVPGDLGGCVYRADGRKVALSERFGSHHGDLMRTRNPERLALQTAPRAIVGRGLYLGHFMGGHYGHFITETLSTFWIFSGLDMASFDYVLFHPFVFGSARPDYSHDCLARFGIAPGQVRLVAGDVLRCEHLTIPERLLRLNHSADTGLRWVYQQISADAQVQPDQPERLYLSRRQFSRRNFDRVMANEVLVENVFRDRGFDIVYPETLPFLHQVGLYRHCAVLAGFSGSALHNAVFMQEGTTLIELGDPRYEGKPAPTQMLCNAIGGVDSCFMPFAGRTFGERRTMLFDIDALEDGLDQAGWTRLTGRSRRSLAANLPEIAYRSVRPGLGEMARRFLKRPSRQAG